MRVVYPSLFTGFSCLAGECPLTCCAGWSVDIDKESLARYRSLPGEEGEEIRHHLVRDGGTYSFTVTKEGRCWFLDKDGLCRMQKDHGGEMLCETCRFFPRLSWYAGSYLQFTMDLACPLVGRMAFSHPFSLQEEEREGEMPPVRGRARNLDVLLAKRGRLLSLLRDPESVMKIVTDGKEDNLLSKVVAMCAESSRVGFLTPGRIRHLHLLSQSYGRSHAADLAPWFSNYGSLLLFRYWTMAWYGMPWSKIARFVRRAMRLTYLILLHQERNDGKLEVDAMVAATVLFARRIEHVERNVHELIMQ